MSAQTNQALAFLLAELRRQKVGEKLIARVERLNPDWQFDTRVRGLRMHHSPAYMGIARLGKRTFIAQYGRRAWELTPNFLKVKNGRRQYVLWHAIAQRSWMLFDVDMEPWGDLFLVPPDPHVFSNESGFTEKRGLSAEEFRAWRATHFKPSRGSNR